MPYGVFEERNLEQEHILNQSYCLNQKRVGIIGGGNIGRQVSAKVQAFGASVQYYDAVRLPQEMEEQWKMTYLPLDELLQTSDIVTLHVPLVEEDASYDWGRTN